MKILILEKQIYFSYTPTDSASVHYEASSDTESSCLTMRYRSNLREEYREVIKGRGIRNNTLGKSDGTRYYFMLMLLSISYVS